MDKNIVSLEGVLDSYGDKVPVEVRFTTGGHAVASFQLLTVESFGGKDIKTWHDITAWRDVAEACGTYPKGTRLAVEGRLSKRSWEDKDGKKKYKTEVVASEVTVVGAVSNNNLSGRNDAVDDVPWD